MKLKDWDDEEEKAGKSKRDRGQRGTSDFTDMDSDALEFEDLDADSGNSGPEPYESPLRQKESGADMESRPGREAPQGIRRRSVGPDRDSEELAPLPAWAKALIFIGLALLAAVICAVLWHFVHPDKPEERDPGILAEASQGEGSGQPQETDANQASEERGEPTAEPLADSAQDPTAEPESGTASESAPTQAPEQPGASAESETSEQSRASDQPQPSQAPSDPATQHPEEETEKGMTFSPVQESVTPKEAVNLRTAPNTADAGNVVVKIANGEVLARIGINNDTGWSQIDYSGQTLYAVSQYLTTDLNYKAPAAPSDPNRVTTADGTVVIFETCDDWITPKEYVNLRTEPSTLQEDATVSCQLHNGEKAHRTGYSPDFGWSRVEYNGQVLYVVTSFVNAVPAE